MAAPVPSPSSAPAALMPTVLAIGLMSGTSQDGVDVAMIETDGEAIRRFGPTAYRTYSRPERALLREATAAAADLTDRMARPGTLAEAEAHGERGPCRDGRDLSESPTASPPAK